MQDLSSNTKPLAAQRMSSIAALSAGFSLTGAGTVMLGVLLPALSRRWALHDDTAGLLLFLQFFGSALGAVFTGLDRVRSLLYGYGLLIASTCALVFAGAHAPFVTFFLFGLGLGMTMTSTSLLFSDRWRSDRAAKLEWLNFTWSAGATAGPLLFLPFLRNADIRALFLTLLGLFSLLFAWVLFRERQQPCMPDLAPSEPANSSAMRFFVPIIVLTMCTVGIEAALSGWLTTYSQRAGLRSLAGAALATSLFWLGEMLSRLAFSTRLLAKMGRHTTLQAAMWGLAASVGILILAPYPSAILAAAGVAGVCMGPLYPLLLSLLLERSARGWVFAVGGFGAASFPWLTGLVSAHFQSLRYGLLAPWGAALLMVVLQSMALHPTRAVKESLSVHS